MHRKLVPMIIWLFLSLAALPASGLSDTHTWVGTVSDYWNVAGNWNPAAVPGTNDQAIINNSDTVMIASGTAFIHQLEVVSSSALNIGGGVLWFQSAEPDNYILNSGTIRVGFSAYHGNI